MTRLLLVPMVAVSMAAMMVVAIGSTALVAGAQPSPLYCEDWQSRAVPFSDGLWYQWYRWCFDPNAGWYTAPGGWDGPY